MEPTPPPPVIETLSTRARQPPARGQGSPAAIAWLRVFAAASIVWFHVAPAGPFSAIGAVGLDIFLCLSFMYLGLQQGFRMPLHRLARQLLLPWAVWWLFYAAVSARLARGVPPALASASSPWELLNWPASHLWYLPFVFVASVVLLAARHVLGPLRREMKVLLAALAGLGLLALLARLGTTAVPAGIAVYAMPAAALGLAYGFCLRLPSLLQSRLAFIAIAAVVTAMSVPIWRAGNPVVAIGYAGGSVLLIACTLPVPRQRLVMRLSTLTLGVYLIHPFVQIALWKVVGPAPSWLVAPATLVVSGLATWGMRRVPALRAIV